MYKNFKLLIFGIIGSIIIMVGVIWLINSDLSEQNHDKMHSKYKLTADKFKSFQNNRELFIKMLAEHPDVTEFLSHTSAESRAPVQSLLFHTAKTNQNIMQLRLLSLDGMELIRVDRTSDNTLHQIQGKKLQNKSKRDYFIHFNSLSENQIGYSELDLNVEHGKVELPWKPTLRIGMPVFEDAKKIGIVIINFSMSAFLKDAANLVETQLTLIDSQGYYILHPDSQKNWSRYRNPPFKDGKFYQLLKAQETPAPFYLDNSNAYPITLFNQEKMLAVFSPKTSPTEDFIYKALEFSLAQLLALLMILIPAILIIKRMIAKLKVEQIKLNEKNTFLDSVLENSFDALIITDGKAIIKRVNKAANILFSYKDKELIGKNIKLLIPQPEHDLHDEHVRNYHNQESKVIGVERKLEAVDKNGNLVPITLAVMPIKINNELFFIGTIRDLSQIVELKAQHKEQENMMHQAKLASMGEMISAISHQWRQPLNSIGLIAQELYYIHEDGDLDLETMKKSREDIMTQLKYMSQTIDDFRHFFSKEKELNTFNAIELVRELERLYAPQLKANSLEIGILCPQAENESCPYPSHQDYPHYEITGYPSELQHVLLNLLSNAKDAILNLEQPSKEQHQIIIAIILEDETIVFELRDLAGGIDEVTLTRLFEPYFTTKEMGTGLGLHIAKTITEQFFKGTLEYRDNIQESYKGSKFRLEIPKLVLENRA
ncbi:PAS domain S-box protein [Sulfurimonas aquatica]|uniref:histidine kinase n=1 Tax=Sulfurimonas aquatica TaxID=2672570 RepID=A0A975AXZ6_9BACT|nr:PAS domain S-box protein [Sulfurimonas aquatica]QSZ40639.1 PAS domain S-box protein [Sulfurimonas aquatica]